MYEQDHLVSTFFQAYDTWREDHSAIIMDCLILLSATRKSLFTNDEEKNKFLDTMMQGIQRITNDNDDITRCCRLLYRFRTNAPLSEMAAKPNYMQWIQNMADFTKATLLSQEDACYDYLLVFWSRLIQNMSYSHYLSETLTNLLKRLSVELTQAFITVYAEGILYS